MIRLPKKPESPRTRIRARAIPGGTFARHTRRNGTAPLAATVFPGRRLPCQNSCRCASKQRRGW